MRKLSTGLTRSDHFGQLFPMYLGDETKVEQLCKNALMGSIIDCVWKDIAVRSVDREYFKGDGHRCFEQQLLWRGVRLRRKDADT